MENIKDWIQSENNLWVRPISKSIFEFIGIKCVDDDFVVCKQIVDISTIGLFRINFYLQPFGYVSLQDLHNKCGENSNLEYATCVFKKTNVEDIADKLYIIDNMEDAEDYIKNICVA